MDTNAFPRYSILTRVACCDSASHRKPCLKAPSYPSPVAGESHDAPNAPKGSPIRVDKSKYRRRIKNVFIDDRGFPDLSDEYDTLLHNVDGGPVLRKLKHSPPPLDVVDPSFNFQYEEAVHGDILRQRLDLSHLDKGLQDTIYALIRKYWSVFDDRGVFVPVKNYECVIDTGDCPGISIKISMARKSYL